MDSNATSFKVLIAVVMGSMQTLLKRHFKEAFPNVKCTVVNNGEDAKDKLLIDNYDLILSDWEMPRMSGCELLTWVRSDSKFHTIPFILITGNTETVHVEKAIQLGVNAYLFKPFTIQDLRQKVIQVSPKFNSREFERFRIEGDLLLKSNSQEISGKIIDVSLGGMRLQLQRNDCLPQIFEKVSVNIEVPNQGRVDGIDGFIVRIQAEEALIDSKAANFALKFIEDLNPEKKEAIKKLLFDYKPPEKK